MQLNTQPAEKQVRIIPSDGSLEVISIFPTVQGEGPYTGCPAVFIRLAGCNLQCPGCDTEYTANRKLMTVHEIMDVVQQLKTTEDAIVVITGGEPLRQDITPLCSAIICQDLRIQIETNGTLGPVKPLPYGIHVVCSPKGGSINPKLLPYITAYKYVMAENSIDPEDGLPIKALDHSVKGRVARPHKYFRGPVYLQPMDEQDESLNLLNQQAVVESCMQYGYRVQLQIHKILDME